MPRHEEMDAAGHLLGEHGVEPVVTGLGAAVRLGDLEAEQALLARLDPHVAGDRPGLEELLHARDDVAVEELARGGAEGLVVLGVETASHGRSLPGHGGYWSVARVVPPLTGC
jgi:hypothetical protein